MSTSDRKSNGESSIYQDPAGRWHGLVSMGLKAGGVRDRRHVSGLRRADVVGKVRDLEQKRDAGTVTTAGKVMKVSAWLDHWLDTIAVRRVRPATLVTYRNLVERHLKPALGHHRLDRLQPEHLETLYGQMLETLSPSTVLQAHRVLSRALKVAMQRGRIARNVATLVDAPRLVPTEVEPLTKDDARAILEAAKDVRNSARWSVALSLGLRQGEALGLGWDCVDLEAGTLRVRKALQRQPWRHGCASPVDCTTARRCPQRKGGGVVLVEPKSRAGKRTITLPAPMVTGLRKQRAEQAADRLIAGSLWEDHGLVFAQPTGRPIDASADRREWKALLISAQVREARLHDARHTAATLLLQQGVPARVAMEILGHSQISLTLGTYSHVVPELANEAARLMGNSLWG